MSRYSAALCCVIWCYLKQSCDGQLNQNQTQFVSASKLNNCYLFAFKASIQGIYAFTGMLTGNPCLTDKPDYGLKNKANPRLERTTHGTMPQSNVWHFASEAGRSRPAISQNMISTSDAEPSGDCSTHVTFLCLDGGLFGALLRSQHGAEHAPQSPGRYMTPCWQGSTTQVLYSTKGTSRPCWPRSSARSAEDTSQSESKHRSTSTYAADVALKQRALETR
jgi:hypothetical protein